VDVVFQRRKTLHAVEVKSQISNDADITRGLFQCIKYQSVLDAREKMEYGIREIKTILVVGKKFPHSLTELRNRLGVKTIEVVDQT